MLMGAQIGSLVPACSAAMYAAYQSGQFPLGCPLCCSRSPWAAAARRISKVQCVLFSGWCSRSSAAWNDVRSHVRAFPD